MNNSGQFIHKQDSKLGLNFFLQEIAHKRDGIEGGGDLERFERIVAEDDGDSFLFGKNENDEAGEFEVG